jgi:hypothetical protein
MHYSVFPSQNCEEGNNTISQFIVEEIETGKVPQMVLRFKLGLCAISSPTRTGKGKAIDKQELKDYISISCSSTTFRVR